MKNLVHRIKNKTRHLIPKQDRLSMFCKVMKDESHFLLNCKKSMEDQLKKQGYNSGTRNSILKIQGHNSGTRNGILKIQG